MNSEGSSEKTIKGAPFNEEKYQVALRSGYMKPLEVSQDGKAIYVPYRKAPAKGSGFGTASMRYIVQESIRRGLDGNVHTAASYSSHLFHLKMGMIPSTTQDRLLVLARYGSVGGSALHHFLTTKTVKPDDLGTLARMLKREKMVSEETVVTPEIVLQHYDELTVLSEKKTCQAEQIIPQLIRTLKKNIGVKIPDTKDWHMVDMHLSDEGKARWKEAIENKTEFVPFHNFEQFTPFCTPEQRKELDDLIKLNNERLAELAANPEKAKENQAAPAKPVVSTTTGRRMVPPYSPSGNYEKSAVTPVQATISTTASTKPAKPPKPALPPKQKTFISDNDRASKQTSSQLAAPVATGKGTFRSETTVSVKQSVTTVFRKAQKEMSENARKAESDDSKATPDSPKK